MITKPVIGPNSRVKLHFTLRLLTGEIVDSTRDSNPAELTIGDGNLLPGFERRLTGLKAGSTRNFVLQPEEAFGAVNPDNITTVRRDKFPPDVELETGLMISFAATGGELPGIVESVKGSQVGVNFNHPLAGRSLRFEVTIIDVRQGLLSSIKQH